MSKKATNKPDILVDMDGVLVNTYTVFCREFNRRHGTNICVDDLTDYSFECLKKSHGVSREEFNDIFDTVGLHQSARELPGATDAVKRLSAEGFRIHIATSRAQILKVETLNWLARYEVPLDSLTIIPVSVFVNSMTKNDVAKMYQCSYAIEDAPSYAHNLANVCTRVFLVDAPYNKNYNENGTHTNIQRVASMAEAADLIIGAWK